MTKKELEAQCRQFQITGRQLANTLQQIRASIKKIEEEAKKNDGELMPTEAMRHETLQNLYTKTCDDVAGTFIMFP